MLNMFVPQMESNVKSAHLDESPYRAALSACGRLEDRVALQNVWKHIEVVIPRPIPESIILVEIHINISWEPTLMVCLCRSASKRVLLSNISMEHLLPFCSCVAQLLLRMSL